MTRVQRIAALGATNLALLLAAGCARPHMSADYGRSSRAFFAKQHVNAEAASGSPKGLDSEEAALIQQSYRQTLGAEESRGADKASNVLLLEESDDAKR